MPKISALPQETEITSNDKIAFVDSDATPQRTHYITLADFVASVFGTGTASGWNTLNAGVAPTVSTGYNKGNKEYDLTFANVNLTTSLSPGMRMKLDRTGSVPTQCTDLEASSSQYWSKTSPSGLSFTDDFTCEAWIKLESYGARTGIVARRNADTEGWSFQVNATGQVELLGLRIASNNRYIASYQSIPIGRWVHVAATLDMSGNTGSIYIDGTAVPAFMTTNGTATALVQGTTALVVGAEKSAGTGPMDGKLSDVRVWSAIRTATEIKDNMNTQLVGSETNLVAYYKLDGDGNDSTSNANNLTGQNSAVATSVDNPKNSTEYAIITKVTYAAPNTTVTVFTGTDYNIPNLTMENPYYSTQQSPFGFPSSVNKWVVETWSLTDNGSPANSTYNHNITLTVPLGEWQLGYILDVLMTNSSAGPTGRFGISTSSSSYTNREFISKVEISTSNASVAAQLSVFHPYQATAQTAFYTVSISGNAGTSQIIRNSTNASASVLRAICAYV